MNAQEIFQEGQQLFMSGRVREAIDKFGEALAAGYDPVVVQLSRGAALINTRNFDQAVNDFNQVLVREPLNERALYFRGVAFLNEEAFERALADLDQAIHLNPQRGAAFLARALAKAELGQEEAAANDFKMAAAYSKVEIEGFIHTMGEDRTRFARSMALLEGDRGPLGEVLTEEEIERLKNWIEP